MATAEVHAKTPLDNPFCAAIDRVLGNYERESDLGRLVERYGDHQFEILSEALRSLLLAPIIYEEQGSPNACISVMNIRRLPDRRPVVRIDHVYGIAETLFQYARALDIHPTPISDAQNRNGEWHPTHGCDLGSDGVIEIRAYRQW